MFFRHTRPQKSKPVRLTRHELKELELILALVEHNREEELEIHELRHALRLARFRIRVLEDELMDCQAGPAVHGVLSFDLAEGANMAEVSLQSGQKAVATVSWTDNDGNPAVAPAGVSVSVDSSMVLATLEADGTVTVMPVSGAGLGDTTVTVTGDGVTIPATGVVHVVGGAATVGTLTFGEPTPQ